MTTAIVLIKSQTDQVSALAQGIVELDGVSAVYSVAGQYDLVAVVQVRDSEELAAVITDRIRKLSGIVDSTTLIAFRAYSQRQVESGFSLGLD
jgi:DNA-binding Lrp family transcriptional regulator